MKDTNCHQKFPNRVVHQNLPESLFKILILLNERSANFFYKGPDSKYSRLCGPCEESLLQRLTLGPPGAAAHTSTAAPGQLAVGRGWRTPALGQLWPPGEGPLLCGFTKAPLRALEGHPHLGATGLVVRYTYGSFHLLPGL